MDDLHITSAQHWKSGEILDIAIAGESIRSAGTDRLVGPCKTKLDAAGWIVSPAFVEAHYHLDKALYTEGALPGAPFEEQLQAVARSKRNYTVESVYQRAADVARAMVGRGISAVRTFADVDSYAQLTALDALIKLRDDLRSLIDIQVVAFPQHGVYADPGSEDRLAEAIRRGADALGGHPQLENSEKDGHRQIDFLFNLAAKHDLDLDFHVDENDDPKSRWLDAVAAATLAYKWNGRVNVAHCASLIGREREERLRLYGQMRDAGITVANSPTSALLFRGHGRLDPTRGLVPVRELLEAGVPVACVQEVYRSVFAPNLRFPDPLFTAQLMAYAAKMSDEAGLAEVWTMITGAPAASLHLQCYGLTSGSTANLVLVKADSLADAFTRLGPNRMVLHKGRLVASSQYHEQLPELAASGSSAQLPQ